MVDRHISDRPFVHLTTLWPRKKAVNDLAVHSSAKLALKVDRDQCLAMLNLVRGRRSFFCRLGKEATLVKYDPNGENFLWLLGTRLEYMRLRTQGGCLNWRVAGRFLCAAPGEIS